MGARVVRQPLRGYGAALQAAIEAARGRIIIMGDSDDSYDWSAIDGFVRMIREGQDLVVGNRFKGASTPAPCRRSIATLGTQCSRSSHGWSPSGNRRLPLRDESLLS